MGVVCNHGRAVLTILVLTPLTAAHAFHSSRSWQPSRPTYVGSVPTFGLSPSTTPGPGLPELLKRDATKTCAYYYGALDGAITCSPGYTCSTRSTAGLWSCCTTGTGGCLMPTACLDYTAYKSGLCSNRGTSTVCCSKTAYPYCSMVALVDKPSVSWVACWNKKSPARVYAEPTTATPEPSSPKPEPSSPKPEPPSPTQDQAGSALPVGTIVGGVIGGVAIIAIAVAIIVWLVIRAKRSNYLGGESAQLQLQQQAVTGSPVAQDRHDPTHLSLGSWSRMSQPNAPGFGASGEAGVFDKNLQTQSQPVPLSPVSDQQQPQQHQQHDLPHYMPGVYLSELDVQNPNEPSS